ncbi:TraR/DksA family transcriptional regulator [Candidatus Uhrbacteria bacterium]|nr:TraR/DksA family transcriptional regulator [Candidatus Uhrbacteria bacterium]
MPLDSKILLEMKEKLLAEKIRLEEKLGSFAKKSGPQAGQYNTQWEEYGDDEEDNAAEVAAFGDSLGLEKTLEAELADTLNALHNIEEGTYGVCASCGTHIDPQRLRVRPQSALCLACKEKE